MKKQILQGDASTLTNRMAAVRPDSNNRQLSVQHSTHTIASTLQLTGRRDFQLASLLVLVRSSGQTRHRLARHRPAHQTRTNPIEKPEPTRAIGTRITPATHNKCRWLSQVLPPWILDNRAMLRSDCFHSHNFFEPIEKHVAGMCPNRTVPPLRRLFLS